MSLEPIGQLMESARQGGYALGYFESWSLDSLQGVIDAAEKVRAPVIIGFNGDFLCHPGRKASERLAWYAALGRAAAGSASVPCGLIFNECPNDEWVRQAAELGFNLVMPADPEAPYEEYERRVRNITTHAHGLGAAVEAEIGTLPCGVGDHAHPSIQTDPDLAARFVAATNVDLLGVSVGNVHIRLEGADEIDLDQLERIWRRVSIPFVLHGGTGIAPASIKASIKLGVRKVNYGTYIKQRYLAVISEILGRGIRNPHEVLGMGGANDLMVAGRRAVRDAVLERIELLGCCGQA